MFEVKKIEYVNKTFRLEKELVDQLTTCASLNNISVNALVAQCCQYAMEHMKQETK